MTIAELIKGLEATQKVFGPNTKVRILTEINHQNQIAKEIQTVRTVDTKYTHESFILLDPTVVKVVDESKNTG